MQGVMHSFIDWACQRIACRVRATRADEDSREWLTCEVDPHGRDEWSVMGRGRTTAAAIRAAAQAWNAYDQAR